MGLFLKIFLAVLLSCKASLGMVATVNLIWSGSLSSYNLQEGSIVQIIAYDHRDSDKPESGAENNFNEISDGVFDPSTVPLGHETILETSISGTSVSETFVIDDFTRLYVRVFYADGFTESAELGYWGLSSSHNVPQNGKPWTTTWYNLMASETNQFSIPYFETIPEPKSLGLLCLAAFLLALRKFRSKIYANCLIFFLKSFSPYA